MESNVVQKMRTALRHCIDELSPYCDGGARIDDVLEEAKSAIAIPDRNCDVGTEQEQSQRFCAFCRPRTEPCDGCACLDASRKGRCEFVWSQMPYEE